MNFTWDLTTSTIVLLLVVVVMTFLAYKAAIPKRTQGFALIETLIILMVLAILAGGVWVWWTKRFPLPTPTITTIPSSISQTSPSPDLMAGWKTFTDKSLGLTFQYPSGWRVQVRSADFAATTVVLSGSDLKKYPFSDTFSNNKKNYVVVTKSSYFRYPLELLAQETLLSNRSMQPLVVNPPTDSLT